MRWIRLLAGVLGAGLLGVAALPATSAAALGTVAAQASQAAGSAPATMLAWGYNYHGALGNGTTSSSSNVPVPVHLDLPPGVTVTAIAAGTYHSLALTSDGQVYAWGWNAFGQLGDGTATDSSVPVPVHLDLAAGDTVIAIAAGYTHSLVLTSAGQVYAWGGNEYGQLGDGTETDSNVPVPVHLDLPAGDTVTAISAGASHGLALTSDGQVLAWGWNAFGQLGDGTATDSSVPVPVHLDLAPGDTVTAIAAGWIHNLALTSDGQVLAWGWNYYGQLGNGTNNYSTDEPVPVHLDLPEGDTVTAIAAGTIHSLALTSNGQVLAWGGNIYGQLGDGTTTDSNVPVRVDLDLPGGITVSAISAGDRHSLALTSDGQVLAWGDNTFGQLGDGIWTRTNVPVQVRLPAGVTVSAISAGEFHSLAISGISITKTGPESFARAGQEVTYTYTVANPTGEPMTGVTVYDSKSGGVACGIGTLAPGTAGTCTAQYPTASTDVAAGKVTNTAYAAGASTGGLARTSGFTLAVPLEEHPALSVTKTGPASFTRAGQALGYTYLVTNTGDVPLHGVTVTDPATTGMDCDGSDLTLTGQIECTASHTVTAGDVAAGEVSNTATATGQTPGNTPVAPATGSWTAELQKHPEPGIRPKPERPVTVRPVAKVPVTG